MNHWPRDYFASPTSRLSSAKRRRCGCLYFIRKHSAIIRGSSGHYSPEDPIYR
ncbi:hypothetical protein KCP73_23315 [Salmonella enterica subsp. enterica]|nr:hypothetical protein KCP73_23315 [Salmonella enterica subsp. enterica]